MSVFTRKLELYDWYRGAQHWRYADGDRATTFQSQAYAPAAITRGALADTQEAMKNKLDVTVPLSLPFLAEFAGGIVPSELIRLNVYRLRDGLVSTVWKGVFANPTFSDKDAVLHHLPPDASAAAIGLTPPWSKTCHKTLYSAGPNGCNVSRALMRVDATVTAVAGKTVSGAAIASKPDKWFARGYIEWQVGLVTERRQIVAHTGDTLTLLTPAPALAVGTVVAVYPGCDQLITTCRDKFNNVANYGGMPYLPDHNPFGSDPTY